VIPADGSSNLFITQKIVGGVVGEVSLVDASQKKVLLVVSDANLFVTAENGTLASLSKFQRFDSASTQSTDDRAVWIVELRGPRQGNKAGSLLLRIAPLHPSGKVVAVGE
jgi:hypothetical protein